MPSAAKAASQWTTYRFDQVAELVNDRVDDPSQAGVDRYVGLEHLDAGSLRISRWGEPSDVTATKLRFRRGDVIFGRRRVYQRKVAVADFEGICSAHAMVLRARPDAVLPEFLPYFMQTDLFMERALQISVGSLSPTINWKALAKEEFALPPVEEQRRIADALGACSRVSGSTRKLGFQAGVTLAALAESGLRGEELGQRSWHPRVGEYFAGWEVVQLGELLDVCQYGLSDPLSESGEYPVLRMMNIAEGRVDQSDLKFIDLASQDFERYRLIDGDVLFNRTNSYELVGRTGVYDIAGDHVFASYLVRLRPNLDSLDPYYLTAFLSAQVGRRQVLSYATRAVSQTNVSAGNLKRVLMPLPPIDYQRNLRQRMQRVRGAMASVRARQRLIRGMERAALARVESQ
ncbi:MAG: restriction endonuclease subunit S [Planctomycetes bacterium]|nr:restriction endonuclease subunit S [Planctomycetota bacterium]